MKREQFRRAAVVVTLTLFIVVIIGIIVLSKMLFGIGVKCPFYEYFGINCPGCGCTRMAISLINLEIYQAFRYNPFIMLTSPLIAYVYVWQAIVYIKHNRLLKNIDIFLITYAIALIIFGIIRNLSLFSALAPTVVK